MILMSVIVGSLMVEVDGRFGNYVTERFPRTFGSNPEGARTILSIIASSMIGIAGVTFSITIVVLSLASAQYTSRVLRNFMRDRANQMVLGVFVSIFVYCLIVLRTIRGGEESFVPSLSVTLGILLGIVGIGFLIFFIHHVATSIQASIIISRIGEETTTVIEGLYPEPHSGEAEEPGEAESLIEGNSWTNIPSNSTGYIQNVDIEGLMEWAAENRTILRMVRGPGEFVIAGNPILAIVRTNPPVDSAVDELNAFLGIVSHRTIEQDAAFGIRQLVDIALKALSPGVNDTTTAVTCLDYLGAILKSLIARKIPGQIRTQDDHVRLIARTQTWQYFADEALSQIRQSARGNIAIHLAMLNAITSALNDHVSAGRRKILQDHVTRMGRVADEHVTDPDDLAVVRQRLKEAEAALRSG